MAKTKAPTPEAKQKAAEMIRDRITEFRRVPSAELETNEKNWRVHPYAQKQAMTEILQTIGIAGAVTAYYSERNNGALTLIDGHERKDHTADWPTLITDLNDEEADLLLLILDPVRGLAEADSRALADLLDTTHPGTTALEDLLHGLRGEVEEDDPEGEETSTKEVGEGPPEMELQPFEHYDYVVLLFKNSLDWMQCQEIFGMGRVAFTLKDGEKRKVGRGRVLDGAKFLKTLEDLKAK